MKYSIHSSTMNKPNTLKRLHLLLNVQILHLSHFVLLVLNLFGELSYIFLFLVSSVIFANHVKVPVSRNAVSSTDIFF